jgi:hypothetical protein
MGENGKSGNSGVALGGTFIVELATLRTGGLNLTLTRMKLYYYALALFNLAHAGMLMFFPDSFLSLWQLPWHLTSSLSDTLSYWGAAVATIGTMALGLASSSVGVQKQGFVLSLISYAAFALSAYRTLKDSAIPFVALLGMLGFGVYSYATTHAARR